MGPSNCEDENLLKIIKLKRIWDRHKNQYLLWIQFKWYTNNGMGGLVS